MTRQPSEHDRYVAKVNSLVAAGRDELADEVAAQYSRTEPSGRDAFWSGDTPGWPSRTGR
jgi:hypothetical protein